MQRLLSSWSWGEPLTWALSSTRSSLNPYPRDLCTSGFIAQVWSIVTSRSRGWGQGWKFQAPNHGLILLVTSSHPKPPRSPLGVTKLEPKLLPSPRRVQGMQEPCARSWVQRSNLRTKYASSPLITQEKGLRSSVPGTKGRDQDISFLLCHRSGPTKAWEQVPNHGRLSPGLVRVETCRGDRGRTQAAQGNSG